ncbi:MAG: hypothetical protein IJD22_02795 [Clostridia bacterium]|nr:hypothetical protein [Clostridia bacterium]
MSTFTLPDDSHERYIMNLFERTEDGRIAITYYPTNGEEPYSLSHKINWSRADAEKTVKDHASLTADLEKLSALIREHGSFDGFKDQLSEHELSVYNTYVRPFDPFKVDLSVIGELYTRGEFDELSEEEDLLLSEYEEWFQAQSLLRLPHRGRSPKYLINRAFRYAALVRLNAPATVIREESRCLAEEMILYYFADDNANSII